MTVNFVQSKRQGTVFVRTDPDEFLNALSGIRTRDRFKVLVVDRRSMKILNRVLTLAEILDHDVARIEKLENNRKEDPAIEALYILTPSKQSIDTLIADFPPSGSGQHRPGQGGPPPPQGRPQRPKYRAAHVFFTSELPDKLLQRIKRAGITSHLKALKELCIEYDMFGSRVFLTQLIGRPMYRLYSPLVTRGFNDELELMSKKLANVCGVLKESPVVRYLLLDQETYGDTKARPLAFLFHTEMDRIREGLPKETDSDKPQTELIIVDRSADPVAPILHEFTYEAMVYDLLDIEDGTKFTYTAKLGSGEEETKSVKLDESDAIWQEFRFQHITEAQEGIMKRFKDLVGSNRAIADMESGEKLNLNKLRDVITTMPQFKGQLGVLSAHITLMEKCMDEFKRRSLSEIALIEQNLVMGTTPDDDKYESGDIDIAFMLNNPDIELRDKLRLLLIFFITNPSLTEAERQKLAALAKFSNEARETIRNMGLVLRWPHALDLLRQLQERPSQSTKSKWGLGAMRSSSNVQKDDEAKPYDVSRYTPALKNVMEGCIEGYLSEELFPYVVPPDRPAGSSSANRFSGSARSSPGQDSAEAASTSMWSTIANSVGLSSDNRASTGSQPTAPRQIKSLRSGRPTWQKRESSPATTTGSAVSLGGSSSASVAPPPPRQSSRGRLILYVIGGITFSEVRAAEELARKHGREVIVGSTHMIEPEDFLYEVSTLSFEIQGSNGRRIDIKPSFFAFGYGGPSEVDPLILYDADADIPKWRSKLAQDPAPEGDRPSRGSHGRPDGRGHERSQSRGQDRRPDGRHGPPLRRGGGRPDAHHSGSSSGGGADRRRPPPSSHSSSASRDNYERDSRSSSRQAAPSARAERPASPSGYGGDQNFRSGYEEYKQQQQQQQQRQRQQMVRSKSSGASLAGSGRSTPQPALSKEEVFRAKFEKSQQQWNSQKLNPAQVNPGNISEMHKVSLKPSGGRGRSGSSGAAEKSGFLRRHK
ncbi:syntaxin binding protein 1 [Coemansia sp. RSA 552]|nr:syntaxin binding protein 1 [Coemansia sp. RSA 552]